MEKEEVFLCLVEKEKVREEKDVYTLVEGGEGERKRMNSIFEGSGSRVINAWVKSKKETQLSLRDCFTRQDKRLLCSLLSPRQAKT